MTGYGVFVHKGRTRVGYRHGDVVYDLTAAEREELLDGLGTVVVSGTPVVRPSGQRGPGDVGPSRRLDIEAELGFVVGVPSQLGKPVSTKDFAAHVFGVVLVNDWSARDIQAWEYQPLGPFLGKSFATSVSPWVVPLDALDAARVPAPPQDPPVLDYLASADRYGYDLRLEVRWNGTVVSRG